MEEAILKVEHLSHRYSVQWAVRDINFEIRQNGIYGLLGSNGAGKSTTMNIICGVLRPTEGNIYVKGINLGSDPVMAKRHIGFLPQKPPLQMDLTVREYLIYSANLHWISGKDAADAVVEVMGKCGISHFANRLIRNLSGGYQQRVGLAQAIIHKPDFIVLDEPTNGLDPTQTMEIRHLIKEIAEERTVILSTHILSEVQATCDHIRMIEQGKLVFSGTINDFDSYILPNTLIVTLVSAPPPEELKSIPGMLKAEKIDEGRYRLYFADACENMEEVVRTSMERGWRLKEIYMEKSSLDTIFAELAGKKS